MTEVQHSIAPALFAHRPASGAFAGSGGQSAVYTGWVTHHRLRPVPHRLRYQMFTILLNLDEVEGLDRRLRLFSVGRFNMCSWFPDDHGLGHGDLRAHLANTLREGGIDPDGGSIALLAMPRMFGFVFNPISFYFCYARGGGLSAIIYEVNNTFGHRHSYLFAVNEDGGEVLRHSCTKALYVSPFIDMGMQYDFTIAAPNARFRAQIAVSDAAGPMLAATETLTRRPLTDWQLVRAFFAYPFQTAKVVLAIHYEAFIIWAKGVAVRDRPPPPVAPVSFPQSGPTPGLSPVRTGGEKERIRNGDSPEYDPRGTLPSETCGA